MNENVNRYPKAGIHRLTEGSGVRSEKAHLTEHERSCASLRRGTPASGACYLLTASRGCRLGSSGRSGTSRPHPCLIHLTAFLSIFFPRHNTLIKITVSPNQSNSSNKRNEKKITKKQ